MAEKMEEQNDNNKKRRKKGTVMKKMKRQPFSDAFSMIVISSALILSFHLRLDSSPGFKINKQ
jgi:hypothetical protein